MNMKKSRSGVGATLYLYVDLVKVILRAKDFER